jgi:hypothetical protein
LWRQPQRRSRGTARRWYLRIGGVQIPHWQRRRRRLRPAQHGAHTCGFGSLAQSEQLDNAARGHANYQAINDLFMHVQDVLSFPRGFTGESPSDRVAALQPFIDG